MCSPAEKSIARCSEHDEYELGGQAMQRQETHLEVAGQRVSPDIGTSNGQPHRSGKSCQSASGSRRLAGPELELCRMDGCFPNLSKRQSRKGVGSCCYPIHRTLVRTDAIPESSHCNPNRHAPGRFCPWVLGR